ncbi:monocarboxylate transporter 13-like isoform X2 [Strongylocentrotus purpuratus]|nr:monocarboxylate transporter 13-like isoform X2 [Strongylocentrotus purpuratus]
MMTSGVLISSGIFLTAFARHIAFVWVGYSLLGGIGASAIYTASAATIRQHYSDRHYALANGAATTGIHISVFVLSPVLRALAFAYGWRGALVIGSGITLNSIVIGALMKPEVVRKRGPVVGDEGEIGNVNDHDDDKGDVDNGTNELLLRPSPSDHQTTATVLESSESHDQGSSAGVCKDCSGSLKNQSCYPRAPMGITVPCDDQEQHGDLDEDIDDNKNEIQILADFDMDGDIHSGVSITDDKEGPQSTFSGIDHVSNCSPSSVNDMRKGDKYHSLESANVVKSTFRISSLFKFSAKPLTRTTKICHVALLIAAFFLAAAYVTVNIFIASAGTHVGLSSMQAATLLSVFGGSQAVGSFFNGIIVKKGYVKAAHLYIGAQILMASAFLVLGLLMRVYVVAILASLAFGVSAGAIISLDIVMQRVVDDSATSISLGWLLFFETFGGLFGNLVLGCLKDLTGSFVLMFVLAAVFTSLSVALTVIILILKKREMMFLKRNIKSNEAI